MALLGDRVQETTTTTGTGTIALGGALTGYTTFNSTFSNGNVVWYVIDDGAGAWEIGYGTVGTGTLTRNVFQSSNANALVDFAAGTKRVFCTAPYTYFLPDQTGNSGKILTTDGTTPSWTSSASVSGGLYASGAWSGTYTDGIVIDYTTGTGRITVGASDGITFYNGGPSSRSALLNLDSSGNLGLGVVPPTVSTGKSISVGYSGSSIWSATESGNIFILSNAYYNGGYKYDISGKAASYYQQNSGIHSWYTAPSGTAGSAISFTQAMTLDASGNLAIGGTTASARLTLKTASAGTLLNTDDGTIIGIVADTTGTVLTYGTYTSHPVVFKTANTERARIDSSGNLGLGVTPSAWDTATPALQIRGRLALSGYLGNSYVSNNAYNAPTGWMYMTSNPASQIRFADNQILFNIAPSGTAGSAISFTQAMTLDASGNLGVGSTASQLGGGITTIQATGTGTGASGGFRIRNSDGTKDACFYMDAPGLEFGTVTSQSILFLVGNTEKMRLTSAGYLGIGTSSPSAPLHVNTSGDTKTLISSGATNLAWSVFSNGTNGTTVGQENSSGGNLASGTSPYAAVFGTNSAYSAQFVTGNLVRATIDSSGNLGLGVTPSAWRSTSDRTIQVNGATFSGYGYYAANITNNAYLDSSSTWRYMTSSVQSNKFDLLNGGGFAWNIAPSGTAGNAISFTQAMTLDASGNLGLGATSPLKNFHMYGATNVDQLWDAGGTVRGYAQANTGNAYFCIGAITNHPTVFLQNGSERARIDSSGNFLVGTTSQSGKLTVNTDLTSGTSSGRAALFAGTTGADSNYECVGIVKKANDTTTANKFIAFYINGGGALSGFIVANGANAAAFASSSDIRLKENVIALPNQLANICALKPSEFDYKDGSGHQIGFIAQEMQEVYPDVVGEGEDGMLTITGWSKTEARLVKAIQELHAELQELKATLH